MTSAFTLDPSTSRKRPWTFSSSFAHDPQFPPSKRVHLSENSAYENHSDASQYGGSVSMGFNGLDLYDGVQYGFLTPEPSTVGCDADIVDGTGSVAFSDAVDYSWTDDFDASLVDSHDNPAPLAEEVCFGMVRAPYNCVWDT